MSERSPSGVASLRARFEQNKESTSPPSRGRSPASRLTSDNSRPVSKVRTSFVSVEGSGKMGDLLEANDALSREAISGEDVENSKPLTNGATTDKTNTNGDHRPQTPSENRTANEPDSGKAPIEAKTKTTGADPAAFDGASDANPDKPVSAAEDPAPSMLPADPKNEQAVSGGAALGEDTTGLGSILKGSPFENGEAQHAVHDKSSTPKTGRGQSQVPKHNGFANGQAKESPVQKVSSPSKFQATPAPPAGKKSATPQKSLGDSSTSEKKPKVIPILPSTASKEASQSKPSKTTPSAPQTPVSATTSSKQPSSVKSSPKPGPAKDAKREPVNGVKKQVGRPSTTSKQPAVATSKPSQAPISTTTRPVKKSAPVSPKPSSSKPRPKSPTRTAKLPTAATAPTAASAAKLDGAPTSTTDRKPTNFLSIRDRVPSNSAKTQPKSLRTSLPAGSKPAEKSKPPRASMASSKGSEGSFLERMMRPTQSSSQKTHEKVESKSPPSKSHSKKLPRISQGSDKSKGEREEIKQEPAEEPPQSRPEETPRSAKEENRQDPPSEESGKNATELDQAPKSDEAGVPNAVTSQPASAA